MKSNFLRKAKWYVIGFILVAIMLSVSLSFCSWDKMSLQAKIGNGSSGQFDDMAKLVEDKDNNNIATVGDIVSFGNYYQNITDDGDIGEKTPVRWIVVEKENNQLTLLAEKVVAFGNFWGNWYNDGTDIEYNKDWGPGWNWLAGTLSYYYQNYSASTLRAWLNSDYTLRSDKGAAFAGGNSQPRFRGFYSEAFNTKEQGYIVSKTMSGIKGYGKDNNPSTRTESYESITDKVWVPSWSEVFGTASTENLGWDTPVDKNWNTYDGMPNTQFSYFKNNNCYYNKANPSLNGYTTAFASSGYSNYTVEGATSSPNMQSSQAGENVWWWLRSPSPSYCHDALVVNYGGSGDGAHTYHSFGGVRPAIIIPA